MIKQFIKSLFSPKQAKYDELEGYTMEQLDELTMPPKVDIGAFKFIADLPREQRQYILESEMGDKFNEQAYYNIGYINNSKGQGFLMIPIEHNNETVH